MDTQREKLRLQSIAFEQRATDLLLGHTFAQQQIGFINTLGGQAGEPLKQRTLLEVEQAAHKKRMEQSSQKAQMQAKVSANLHRIIEQEIDEQIEHIDILYFKVMGIEQSVPTLLDILGSRSPSMSRLEPLINSVSWLGRELVSLVNLPQYRQERFDRGVKIDTPALAMRYLGLDNLRLVLPTYAVRHWLPHSTAPFSLLKRKLRDNAMSSAIVAYELAKKRELDSYTAFISALLLEVGKVALTRLYLQSFERISQEKIMLAREEGNKPLHDALLSIKPDPLCLRNLFLERSLEITRALVEQMHFRYLSLNNIYDDYAFAHPADQNPLAQVLSQAHCYAQVHMLKTHQLIEEDEIKLWFTYAEFTKADLEYLERVNLTNLALKIER